MPRARGVPQYGAGAQKFHARVRPDILVPASNIAEVHLAPSKPDVRRPAGPPPSRNSTCKRSLLTRAHCQLAAAANRLPSGGSRPEESPPPVVSADVPTVPQDLRPRALRPRQRPHPPHTSFPAASCTIVKLKEKVKGKDGGKERNQRNPAKGRPVGSPAGRSQMIFGPDHYPT